MKIHRSIERAKEYFETAAKQRSSSWAVSITKVSSNHHDASVQSVFFNDNRNNFLKENDIL